MENLIELFYKGGWVMWPLLILGIVSISIFTERMIYFYISYISNQKIHSLFLQLEEKLQSPKKQHPHIKIHNTDMNISNRMNETLQLISLYLQYWDHPEARKSTLERNGTLYIKNLQRRISILSLNAQIAPLLGLLGTVLGMIEAFQNISSFNSQPAPSIIAGGIWVAMLTTAFGLIIAIISHILYAWLDKLVRERIDLMNYAVHYLDELYQKSQKEKINEISLSQ